MNRNLKIWADEYGIQKLVFLQPRYVQLKS